MAIPKLIHIVWVGDEHRRPDAMIDTWCRHHPDWEVRIWGNADLAGRAWVNHHHLRAMWDVELCGVADLMRYEILAEQGGIAVDADSECVRPLDDWLLECEAFACWEQELDRPGLIALGALATVPGNPFFHQLVQDLHDLPDVTGDRAWLTVGTRFLTDAHRRHRYTGLTVLPSHFFLPEHYGGASYTGGGPVYARQAWASTLGTYEAGLVPSAERSPGDEAQPV